ncbi:ubiquitin-specific protease [Datura stramonium]|uniref:Ubiquitin-specific protease n=1 Tax=Datura stramonium TaxID=4076 RepID=A0ABS8S706_DATST|nr:ubiquitin-specific protease [Datura stramonium]
MAFGGRREEIKRLLVLASEEAARVELQAAEEYGYGYGYSYNSLKEDDVAPSQCIDPTLPIIVLTLYLNVKSFIGDKEPNGSHLKSTEVEGRHSSESRDASSEGAALLRSKHTAASDGKHGTVGQSRQTKSNLNSTFVLRSSSCEHLDLSTSGSSVDHSASDSNDSDASDSHRSAVIDTVDIQTNHSRNACDIKISDPQSTSCRPPEVARPLISGEVISSAVCNTDQFDVHNSPDKCTLTSEEGRYSSSSASANLKNHDGLKVSSLPFSSPNKSYRGVEGSTSVLQMPKNRQKESSPAKISDNISSSNGRHDIQNVKPAKIGVMALKWLVPVCKI